MNHFLQAVQEFHEKYSHFHQITPISKLPKDIIKFRKEIMTEELHELIEAMDEEDLPHISKELVDMLYVVLGTIETYGLAEQFDEIFKVVHESNMSKDVPKTGKAIKGKNFFKAEEKIKEILKL